MLDDRRCEFSTASLGLGIIVPFWSWGFWPCSSGVWEGLTLGAVVSSFRDLCVGISGVRLLSIELVYNSACVLMEKFVQQFLREILFQSFQEKEWVVSTRLVVSVVTIDCCMQNIAEVEYRSSA